jgi:hypothetical protein
MVDKWSPGALNTVWGVNPRLIMSGLRPSVRPLTWVLDGRSPTGRPVVAHVVARLCELRKNTPSPAVAGKKANHHVVVAVIERGDVVTRIS